MPIITSVKARQILNSRGQWTIECTLVTKEATYVSSVPSGASTGSHEALEKRDEDGTVTSAVNLINTTIARKIKGTDTKDVDSALLSLDKTKDKRILGANTTLAVSSAAMKAHLKPKLIPIPAFNVINGGKHAGNKLDFQEFMIIPTGAKTFQEALDIATEVYSTLRNDFTNKLGRASANVGDEGGFAPALSCIHEPLDYLADALMRLGYWKKVKLGIDCAASTLWKQNCYLIEGKHYSTEKLTELYEQLLQDYPILSLEDPYHEDAFLDFATLTHRTKALIIGDDLLTTNAERIAQAASINSCNTLLLKPNQIGTITEATRAVDIARQHNWKIMASHRSGETNDTFIAEYAAHLGTEFIKAGAPARGERVAKYNKLLQLEQQGVKYAGKTYRTS